MLEKYTPNETGNPDNFVKYLRVWADICNKIQKKFGKDISDTFEIPKNVENLSMYDLFQKHYLEESNKIIDKKIAKKFLQEKK
jgi:hypothetical protein